MTLKWAILLNGAWFCALIAWWCFVVNRQWKSVAALLGKKKQ